MRRVCAATSLVATAVLTVGMTGGSASADVLRMRDRVGDDSTGHGAGDVRTVRLNYGAHRLRVTIRTPASGDPAYYQDLYLDTWPKHQGPEVLISANGDGEGWSVSLGGGWDVGSGTERCRSRPGAVSYDLAHHRVSYRVPVGCLKPRHKAQPPRIRASLVTRAETEKVYDWVPGRRAFGRWIAWK